jgi:hypothetical protein
MSSMVTSRTAFFISLPSSLLSVRVRAC